MLLLAPRLLAATLLFQLVIISTQAQDEVSPARSPKLVELSLAFVEKMRQAMAPAGNHYLSELGKLERKFALAGNYEAAIAVRDERAAVTEFLGDALESGIADTTTSGSGEAESATDGDSSSSILTLTDTAADISEGAQFTESGLALGAPGATASWQFESSEAGGYEIVVTYSSNEEASVQLRESFFRLSGDLPASGGKKSSRSLGTLNVTSLSDSVSLIHTGESEQMELIIHSIQLISAKD